MDAPRGGSAALPLALARLIEEHGGTILCDRRVTGLVLEDGRCVGVETADGEQHLASRAVLSTVHPAHLLEMAPRDAWGDDWAFTAETWRAGVCLFPTHLATTVAPAFAVDGGEVVPVASGIAPSVDRLLRLGSDVERGLLADDDPPLLVVCATVADHSRAPEGRHVLKLIGFHPYALADGGSERWDEVKEDVAGRNLEQLRRYAPNLTQETILAQVVKSPVDLERMNGHNWHGTCHGGDLGPAQSGTNRFAPATPIPGLFQTGATTHPGGSVSAAPGATPRSCSSRSSTARSSRRWERRPVPTHVSRRRSRTGRRASRRRASTPTTSRARPRGSRPGTSGYAWVKTGDEHRALAEEAEALGRAVTRARRGARRSPYHFAKFVWLVDVERNHEVTRLASDALYAAHRQLDPSAERVEVPWEGATLVGNLRGPRDAALVLLLPGLDSTKEEFFHWEDVFLRRGLATFSYDGPGQGECGFATHIRGDYEVAVSAARPRRLAWTTGRSARSGSRSAATTRRAPPRSSRGSGPSPGSAGRSLRRAVGLVAGADP